MFDAVGLGAAAGPRFPRRSRPVGLRAPGRAGGRSSRRRCRTAMVFRLVDAAGAFLHGFRARRRHGSLSLTRTDGMPIPTKQIFSQQTAREVRTMLEMAAQPGGTAPKAQIPGYRVGGKTGPRTRSKAVSTSANTSSSFVGFAPVSDPRLVVAVMIDEPSAGGTTAATWPGRFFQCHGRRLAHAGRPAGCADPDGAQRGSREGPGRKGAAVTPANGFHPAASWRNHAKRIIRRSPTWAWLTSVADDSRKVSSGDLFMAYLGDLNDGRRFIADAIAAVPRPCSGKRAATSSGMPTGAWRISRSMACAPLRAARARRLRPAERTPVGDRHHRHQRQDDDQPVARSLASAPLRRDRHARRRFCRRSDDTGLTTPEATNLARYWPTFADAGAQACAVEASSIGIEEDRLDGGARRRRGLHQSSRATISTTTVRWKLRWRPRSDCSWPRLRSRCQSRRSVRRRAGENDDGDESARLHARRRFCDDRQGVVQRRRRGRGGDRPALPPGAPSGGREVETAWSGATTFRICWRWPPYCSTRA